MRLPVHSVSKDPSPVSDTDSRTGTPDPDDLCRHTGSPPVVSRQSRVPLREGTQTPHRQPVVPSESGPAQVRPRRRTSPTPAHPGPWARFRSTPLSARWDVPRSRPSRQVRLRGRPGQHSVSTRPWHRNDGGTPRHTGRASTGTRPNPETPLARLSGRGSDGP